MALQHPIKGILFDLDGVLYIDQQVIDGALETVEKLRLPHRFITNTTTQSTAMLCEKLHGFGFAVEQAQIISAPYAAVLHLRQLAQQLGRPPRCFLLLHEAVKADFHDFEQADHEVDAVVIGDIGEAWSYALLNQAFNLLMDGAALIALHKNRFWQVSDGLKLDIGAFVNGLEFASSQTATVIGKPNPAFFQMALQDLALPAAQVAIIGDDIDSDIGGGQASGLQGILVKTGKYREAYARQSAVKPNLVMESVRELSAWL